MTLYRDIHGPTLYDEEAAREFVFALSHEERERLLVELHKFTGAQSSGKCVCVCACAHMRACECESVCVCVCVHSCCMC